MNNAFNLVPSGAVLFEAVTTAEFKSHARISITADDAYIATLVVGARQQLEKDLNLAIVGQNYDLHIENGFWDFYQRYFTQSPPPEPIWNWYPRLQLPILPVSKDYPVVITYTDENGSPQTWNASNYDVRYWKDPPEIALKPTGTLPAIQPGSEVIVNFTAGFVTTAGASTLPLLYKQAIQLLAASWYENREGTSDAIIRTVPLSYERIKNLLQVKRFV